LQIVVQIILLAKEYHASLRYYEKCEQRVLVKTFSTMSYR
jgi:hypothetical protein